MARALMGEPGMRTPSVVLGRLPALATLAAFTALMIAASPARADTPATQALLDERIARGCVAAAMRASGLGEDDHAIDSLIARSKTSAALPEASVRAMQLWSEADSASTVVTSDATTLRDVLGSHFVIDVRLSWKLDRLVYAGDEAALERIRIERHEARARLATRTLDALFALERARADVADANPGSREALEAHLRAAEARATLDVLTGGWFSAAVLHEAAPGTSP
jgi:hypothetical protein